ncbi:MAG: GDP-mannose 4,6-dehydratase [Sterolibacterium sp.]|nr:GDP-mannose 4,6-dehydratase [Sterolibacterium sp.]
MVKRLFLTGETGFVGGTFYGMAEEIMQDYGWELIPASHKYDVRDTDSLVHTLRHVRADGVIHLAGLSFIPDAIENPVYALQVNQIGTLNLLQALRHTGFCGDFLYVSSGDVYGQADTATLPIQETHPVQPHNIYAISKIGAEMLCAQWCEHELWRTVVARPFNHIGPGQHMKFVVSSLARQVARIRLGLSEPVIEIGDIDVTRDFTDVRDLAHAYMSLLTGGEHGGIYNVCSNTETSIRELLDRLVRMGGVAPEIRQLQSLRRPGGQRRVRGDNTKLCVATGWQPRIPLDDSLRDVLRYWENVESAAALPTRFSNHETQDVVRI